MNVKDKKINIFLCSISQAFEFQNLPHTKAHKYSIINKLPKTYNIIHALTVN